MNYIVSRSDPLIRAEAKRRRGRWRAEPATRDTNPIQGRYRTALRPGNPNKLRPTSSTFPNRLQRPGNLTLPAAPYNRWQPLLKLSGTTVRPISGVTSMRNRSVTGAAYTIGSVALLATLFACSSRSTPATANAPLDCPNRMMATVANRRNVGFDVYYQEGSRPATIVGEVAAGSTQTYTLPGEGRGRVYLRGPGGGYVSERPGNPIPDLDIRLFCAS